MKIFTRTSVQLLLAVMLLTACAGSTQPETAGSEAAAAAAPAGQARAVARQSEQADAAPEAPAGGPSGAQGEPEADIYRGTGVFVRAPRARPSAAPGAAEDGITLNFVQTGIEEVVAAVLGDFLKLNYAIDPEVSGSITVQTSRPIARDALLPTLETVLRLNNAAIVETEGLYKVLPLAKAREPGVPVRTQTPVRGRGYSVLVAPLRYVPATEMEKILAPVALKENILRVDPARNVIMLAGTQGELEAIQEVIDIFDVDWLGGMSFGLFRVRFIDPPTVVETLDQIFLQAGDEARAGLVQFVPIERLNTVLVISRQAEFVERAKVWIERLDRTVDGADRRIFVYRVQNSRAEGLASALRDIFAEEQEGPARPAPIAPGLEPIVIGSAGAQAEGAGGAPAETAPPPAPGAAAGDGIALPAGRGVRIIADPEHNAIIILATPQDYRMIEATLRELDTVPLQVLIQATIFEVTLTDDLSYGVRWFFERSKHSVEINALPAAAGAFSYAFASANFVASIDALSNLTDLKIVSSPELLVLDNQTASLQVGDQVPVATRQSVSVTDPEAPVVNSIQFRNTGVILRVTPRVNVGGLVTLDIEQEVSDVASTEPTVTPTIFQRSIQSTVAVQNGESVALGGLISESDRQGRSGVPVLMEIPILGALFRSNEEETRRTELLVLLTPTVVRNPAEARIVTDEMRRRMTRVHQHMRKTEAARAAVPELAPAMPPADESRGAPMPAPPAQSAALAPAAPGAEPESGSDSAAGAGRTPGAPDKTLSEIRGRTGDGGLLLHLASYRSEERARREWEPLRKKFPDILGPFGPVVRRVDLPQQGTFYRLSAGPAADRGAANAACRLLRSRGQYCQVLPSVGG